MRATSLLRKLLGITVLFVLGVDLQQDGRIIADVRPRWHRPRCGVCGKTCPGYDTLPARYWRHLGPGNVTIWLRYAPRRVDCSTCGVKAEVLPWEASARTGFTKDFEETVANLAQITDKSTFCNLAGIAWRTVEGSSNVSSRCASTPTVSLASDALGSTSSATESGIAPSPWSSTTTGGE